MFVEGTSVGLDVHARSVRAAAIDGETGELLEATLSPAHPAVLGWVAALPGPAAVTYEAGPTGFGLARALTAAGIRCEVAAPSKLQRPSGHRVKTDRGDARWLSQLLRLDQIVSVRVPTAEQEATRDLVRAREDARGDLMRARHRVSKLLLRHGLVYPRKAWTRPHHDWLTGIRFDRRATALAFEADLDAVLLTTARRDRLDKIIDTLAADCEYTEVTRRLGCLRGVSTLTGFTLAVEIGDWDRFTAKTIGAYLGPGAH
jgi:transposase